MVTLVLVYLVFLVIQVTQAILQLQASVDIVPTQEHQVSPATLLTLVSRVIPDTPVQVDIPATQHILV